MSILTAYTAIDMSGSDGPFTGTVTSYDSSHIVVNYPGSTVTDVYYGSFSYSNSGNVFGVLTGYQEYAGNTLLVDIRNGAVDANIASNLVLTGQNHALLQFALGNNDLIFGSNQNDVLRSYGGNDAIVPGLGNDIVDGGDGFDTVVIHSNFGASISTINFSTGTVTVNGPDGFDTINNVERIQFNDAVVALDIQGNAGNAYRLYQAAFHRTPDQAGLSFWTHQLDLGLNIQTVAQGFVNSAEFQSVYGVNPTHAHIVDLMYQNVLGRPGEAAGINFWVGQLDHGLSVGALLQGFSVSSENHANVDPTLVTGITLNSTAFLV